MRPNLDTGLQAIWILAGVVWLVGCRSAKPDRRREAARTRFLHIGLIASAFALLFSAQLRVGVLAIRAVPHADWVRYVGLSITGMGIGFAIWGRVALGRNWSGVVTIKEEHSLVRHGPYTIVRHPIYSGLLLAMVGTALAYGRVACLLAVPIGFAAWWLKSQVEEEFLVVQFTDAYTNYQKEVRALIPFVV